MALFGGGGLSSLMVLASYWFTASLILDVGLISSGQACLIGSALSGWISVSSRRTSVFSQLRSFALGGVGGFAWAGGLSPLTNASL